jgi:hypothetical protein
MQVSGWIVVAVMSWMGYETINETFQKLWK